MATKKQPAAPVKRPAVSLKVMAEDTSDEAVSKLTDYAVHPLRLMTMEGFNGRPISREKVEKFKEDKRNGATFPHTIVWVENGVTYLLDGHHRNVADRELIAEGLDIKRTPCIEFKGNAAARIVLMMGANEQDGLTPLQLGVQYKKLRDVCGWTNKEIAKASPRQKSEQHVADMILLANADSDVLGMVTRGEVKATTALKVVKSERSGAGKVLTDALAVAKTKGDKVVKPKAVADAMALAGRGADKYVAEVKERAAYAKKHLAAMLDSPTLDEGTRDAIGKVMQRMKVSHVQASPLDDKPVLGDLSVVREWLSFNSKSNPNHRVTDAAKLLYAISCGNPFPPAPSTKMAVVLTCMQEYIADAKTRPALREAMRFAYMHLTKSPEQLASLKPPSILPLHDAIQAEIDSQCSARADVLCPEYAKLVNYLRGSK